MAECIRTSRSSSLVTPLLMAPLTCHWISWARPSATSMAIVSMLRVPREMPSRPQTEPKQYRVTSSSNSRVNSGWLSTLARPCSGPSISSRIAIPFSYGSSSAIRPPSVALGITCQTIYDLVCRASGRRQVLRLGPADRCCGTHRQAQAPPGRACRTGGTTMSDNLLLVFSTPPAGVSADEFSDWYDVHVSELVAVDGVAGARRYRVATIKGDWAPSGEQHLAVYET